MADDYDAKVARIDLHRARRIGEILVSDAAAEGDTPKSVLVDIDALDGKQLLAQSTLRQSRYGTTPFDPEGHLLRLFPGGVTIWSGFPGSGKTTLLRQLVCQILARGSSVFLASLEEDPSDVIVRLAATAAGRMEPNAHQVQWFIDAYAKRFRLWGMIGIAEHRQLLSVIRNLAGQGIRHAVIDSLMCLDVANDDFEGQRKFANLVSATARAAGIHLHLVAHPRKLISADQEPDLNDVAGARELGGIADNVIFVRRTKDEHHSGNITPMAIIISKQRHHNGHVGKVNGWFHRDLRQFHLDQFQREPTRYLPDDAFAPITGAYA